MFVKLLDHGTHSRDSSRQIAQQVELVAIVNPQVGVNMPNENGINRTNAIFGFAQKAIDCVLALLRIIKAAVPNEQLHL